MSQRSVSETQVPVGTWKIDPVHSSVEFSVRHLMVSNVKGRFTRFSGTITVAEDPLDSTVEAVIELASVDTHDHNRDEDVRSKHWFDVQQYPFMTFHSTSLRPEGDGYVLTGDLTLHGVTKSVELDLVLNGTGPDSHGGTRAGFTATTELNRKDFGLTWSMAVGGAGAVAGAVVVGERVAVTIEIEAVLQRQSDSA
jgi:polyisoprenoid-binding protein YceI